MFLFYTRYVAYLNPYPKVLICRVVFLSVYAERLVIADLHLQHINSCPPSPCSITSAVLREQGAAWGQLGATTVQAFPGARWDNRWLRATPRANAMAHPSWLQGTSSDWRVFLHQGPGFSFISRSKTSIPTTRTAAT
jgi:hypothetical protein